MSYPTDDDAHDNYELREKIRKLQEIVHDIYIPQSENVGPTHRNLIGYSFGTPNNNGGNSGGTTVTENSKIKNYGTVSGTVTIDQSYKGHRITLEGDVTIQFDGNIDANLIKELAFFIIQKAGNSYTVTWPDSVKTRDSLKIQGTANTNIENQIVGFTADGGTSYELSHVYDNKVILGDTGNVFLGGDEDPTNNLGADLDFFIQNTTSHLWRKINGVWSDIGKMLGADGEKYFYESLGFELDVSLGNVGDFFVTIGDELLQKIEEVGTGIMSWTLVKEAFGAKGDAGPQGPQGDPGKAHHNGDGLPADDLGETFESYFDYTNNDWYVKTSEGWQLQTNLKGEQGLQGPIGPNGPQGPRGPGVFSGQADPVEVETGYIEGDKLLNEVNGKLFEVVSDPVSGALQWVFKMVTKGADGNDGSDGAMLWYEVAGVAIDDARIKLSDYFVSVGNELLQRVDDAISGIESFSLVQEAFGAKGDQGIQGEKGNDGYDVLNGDGVPPATLGKQFDSYFDSINKDWYVKTSSGWQLQTNLQGPQGIQGPVGPNGADGAKGDTGDVGLQGPVGPTGIQGPSGHDGIDGQRGTRHIALATDPTSVPEDGMEGDTQLNYTTGAYWILADVDGTLEWFKRIESINGKDGKDALQTNLGEIEGNQSIDLSNVNPDFLSAVIKSDTVITFENIPDVLFLEFKTAIKTTGATLSMAGTALDVGTVSGDVYVWSIKKLSPEAELQVSFLAEEDKLEFPVNAPSGFSFVTKGDQEILANWGLPTVGNLPISFDLAISTEDSVDENGLPNGSDVTFYNEIESFEKLFDGLNNSTEYFCWIRAKNVISESVWLKLSAQTDVPLTAEILGFSVESPDFQTIQGVWSDPEGREYFHSFSLTQNGETEHIRTKSKSTGFSINRRIPNTEYSYVYTVENEFGRMLFTDNGTVTTTALPVPSKTVGVSGTSISVDVTIPSGVEKVRLDHDIKNDFSTNGYPTQDIQRSIGSNIDQPETKTVTLPNKNPSTEYFVRASSEFLGEQSGYSATESVTTGSYLAPQGISSFNVTFPESGLARIRGRWGSEFRGEWCDITIYQNGVAGFSKVKTVFRDGDPNDLDDRENRFEILVDVSDIVGQTWTFIATAENFTDPVSYTHLTLPTTSRV